MKQLKLRHFQTPSGNRSTIRSPTLSQEILSAILSELQLSEFFLLLSKARVASHGRLRALLSLASVCAEWRRAFLPLAFSRIQLRDVTRVSSFARLVKQNSLGSLVQQLSVSVSHMNTYKGQSSSSLKSHSIQQILRSCPSLTSLSLAIGSPTNAFSVLFKDLTKTFAVLVRLKTFILKSEVWLHDLATLLQRWPALSHLELGSVRGDCGRKLEWEVSSGEPGCGRPMLRHLEITSNTLTGEHIIWLLRGQTALEHLALQLPGADAPLFTTLETLAPSLRVLHLSNRFKSALQLSSSPLLPLLRRSSSLTELRLATDFAPAEQLDDLFALPELKTIRRLFIEDTVASGIRVKVEEAMRKGHLDGLAEVVSAGGKKIAGGAKAFQSLCEQEGVVWTKDA